MTESVYLIVGGVGKASEITVLKANFPPGRAGNKYKKRQFGIKFFLIPNSRLVCSIYKRLVAGFYGVKLVSQDAFAHRPKDQIVPLQIHVDEDRFARREFTTKQAH